MRAAAKPYLYTFLFASLTFTMGWQFQGAPTLKLFEMASQENTELPVPFRLKDKETIKKEKEETSEVAPVIEHALDTIDRTKRLSDFFGFLDNTANRNCPECETQLQSLRYSDANDPKQCNSQNSYLEKEMTNLASGSSLMSQLLSSPIRTNSIIKPACMRMSMEAKFGASSRSFRQCNDKGTATRAFRPCITENYFKLMNNSFDLVSSCMKDFIAPGGDEETQKLDVRAAYALINVESGFHVNAMSGTGAGGIGQFTEVAIRDVNENELSEIRMSLEGNKNPYCAQLSMEHLDSLQPIRPEYKNSCDRISLKRGNPVTNMIYTFAYLKGIKRDFNNQIFDHRNYKKKFNMSEEELNKIKRALMVWSHNTGPSGTWTPAKTLLNTVYRNKKVTDADKFINEMQQYLQKFPASANKSSARRKETSHYFPSITKTLNSIEQNVGGGSCVNF